MSPQISKRTQDILDGKGRAQQTWDHVLDEPDYRKAPVARVVNCFLNAQLFGRFEYQAHQVRSRSDIEPLDLKPGEIVLMVNRAKTGFAMLCFNRNIVFHKEEDAKLSMASFDSVALAFQQAGIDYDPALKRVLLRVIERREESKYGRTAPGRGVNQVALDIINKAKGTGTVVRDEDEEK